MNIPYFHLASKLSSSITDLLFPPTCIHCNGIIENPGSIPLLCNSCHRLIRTLPPGSSKLLILDRLSNPYIDDFWIAFEFNEVLQTLIHHVKYLKKPKLGVQLGLLAARSLSDRIGIPNQAIGIPVPLHPLRHKERGYNQSSFIGRGFLANEQVNLEEAILKRIRNTASQTNLSREERIVNVHRAFALNHPGRIQGKTVLLIDDVATTGATLNECARVLKDGGASRVIGLTLATPLMDV